HAGAQSTWDTLQLAAHAADIGADAVAVIAPPYFPLDDSELFEHLAGAARACDPTPFYVYEFAARSGYAVPLSVLERLREAAANFRGLKVSDVPWERFAPYLVAAAVRDPERAALGPVRDTMQRFPFQAALKTVVARRGVPMRSDVRRPLRGLTAAEREELETWLESSLPAPVR